jgi:hypothetical protein
MHGTEINVGRQLTVTFGAVSMSGGAVRVVDEKLRPLWAATSMDFVDL